MKSKTVNGYNLSIEYQEWLAKKAKESDMSASAMLNQILKSAYEKDKNHVKKR